MPDRDHGSFLGGFTLGMMAGAVGYFLFATEKGRKLKTQLAKEWQAARMTLPEQAEGLTKVGSLRELLLHVKQHIDDSTTAAEQKQSQAAQPKKKAAPKKVTKFKGVKKLEL